MCNTKRCAMLDADFISKLYCTHIDETNRMIFRVLDIPDLNFVCHEQTKIELSRHNQSAFQWLETNPQITVYSDRDLIQLMINIFGESAYAYYSGMLRRSCNIFSSGFYVQYYSSLDAYLTGSWGNCDLNQFVSVISSCDGVVGTDNNLGEIKLYTMAQILDICGTENLFLFCSDDKKARTILSNQTNVDCVGAIASFYLAKNYLHMSKEEAQEFFDSWMRFHRNTNGQQDFRVLSVSGYQMEKINGQDIFDKIYNDEFELMKNGFLHRKT